MDFHSRSLRLFTAAILAVTPLMALTRQTLADNALCSGHQLLSKPRPETSCQNVKAQIFVAPDKATHAQILPADVSLYATPDMESRIVFRSSSGDTLTSQDFSSPRGANGYYVAAAQWSPDSQYFVFSLISSGGHSPWSYPMKVYSLKKNVVANFSDMIGGNPTVSEQFRFAGPHTVVASTWKQPGATDVAVPVTVDLEAAFQKLPPAN
jgi:hypothetical protein